jgi:uncharacterized protein (TIGR03546 family)
LVADVNYAGDDIPILSDFLLPSCFFSEISIIISIIEEELMFFKWIAALIIAINANTRAGEIAAGAACGFLLALLPAGNLLWIALFLIFFFTKINLGAEFLFIALFKLPMSLLAGLLHSIGYFVLTQPVLQGIFTALFNIPFIPYTRFNNTVVMGALITGIVLWLPFFFLLRLLVQLYRKNFRDKIAGSRLAVRFRRLPLVISIARAAQKISGIYAG